MEKTVKVGMMPGRINEFAVAEGMSVKEVLELAGLDSNGYDIKGDGEIVSLEADASTFNKILLTKQVKGNSDGVVKIGMMPGRINEYAIQPGTTVDEALNLADLDPDGYDVKGDGQIIDLNDDASKFKKILLTKQVKGNW